MPEPSYSWAQLGRDCVYQVGCASLVIPRPAGDRQQGARARCDVLCMLAQSGAGASWLTATLHALVVVLPPSQLSTPMHAAPTCLQVPNYELCGTSEAGQLPGSCCSNGFSCQASGILLSVGAAEALTCQPADYPVVPPEW